MLLFLQQQPSGSGQDLWLRAKRLIPGGNMLLSKRAEMFLPEQWPAYFSRAKGCRVWDLNGRELIDMSIMGIGTNLLGYGHPEVDAAVAATAALATRALSTARKRSGWQNGLWPCIPGPTWPALHAVAVRRMPLRYVSLAQPPGEETVAICGYHGWHDWYLATNLQNDSGLEEHLLPGLEPNGVPKGLAGTVQPFSFNRLDQLESIAANHELAAVKMEVQRSAPPQPDSSRAYANCTRRGIVLIFDECTSGFREDFWRAPPQIWCRAGYGHVW